MEAPPTVSQEVIAQVPLLSVMGVKIDPGSIGVGPGIFNPGDCFKVGIGQSGVCITYMSPEFVEYLHRVCPRDVYKLTGADYLHCARYRTTKPAIDCGGNGIIPATQRNESFVTLYHVWQCLKIQPRPVQGSVLEVGMPNIFYVQEPPPKASSSAKANSIPIRLSGIISVIEDCTDANQPGWAITYHRTTHGECPENFWPAGTSLWVSQCAA